MHEHHDEASGESGYCLGCGSAGLVGEPCTNLVCDRFRLHLIPGHDAGLDQHDDSYIGRKVGDFLIVELIGVGGFGRVYRAVTGPDYRDEAAVKFLRLPDDERLRKMMPERFTNEARVLEDLDHPNIVKLLAHCTSSSQPYIAMEYLRSAVTLRDDVVGRIKGGIWYDQAQVRGIMLQVLDALQAAHERGVVHRDVKPENIMLQYVDSHVPQVKLVDFGTAKIIEAGSKGVTQLALGSPSYMAPEQFELENIGTWTDVYAAAIVAFELFGERKPFPGDDDREILKAKFDPAFDPFDAVTVAPQVESILRRAMADEPEYRFPDAGQFRDALLHALDDPAFELEFNSIAESSEVEDTAVAPYNDEPQTRRKTARIPTPTPYSLEMADLEGLDTLEFDLDEASDAPDDIAPPLDPATAGVEPARSDSTDEMAPQRAGGSAAARFLPERHAWRAITLMLALILLAVFLEEKNSPTIIVTAASPAEATTSAEQSQLPVRTRPTVVATAAFSSQTCLGRDDGAITCWGDPALTRGSDSEQAVGPWRLLSSPLAAMTSIEQDDKTSACLLLEDGNVRCWGYNDDGRLGYGHTKPVTFDDITGESGFYNVPTGRPGISIASSSAGAATCVVLDDGTLRCWRAAEKVGAAPSDHVVHALEQPILEVVATDDGFCARTGDGGVLCGDASKPGASFERLPLEQEIVSLTAGAQHACALDKQGTAWCWGSNDRGQLGIGAVDDERKWTPVAVPIEEDIRHVAAGRNHTCALMEDGFVRCWGDNQHGQLGLGSVVEAKVPVPDSRYTMLDAPARTVFAGGDHTCAIMRDSRFICWGRNDAGQLDGASKLEDLIAVASRAL